MRFDHCTECLGGLGAPLAVVAQLFDTTLPGGPFHWPATMVGITLLGSTLGRIPEWLSATVRSAYARAFQNLVAIEAPPAVELAVDAEVSGESTPPQPDLAKSLVDIMLDEGRYSLLLRPQLIANLTSDQIMRARTALAEGMCVVPGGEVVVRQVTTDDDADPPLDRADSLRVEAYFIDRNPVTNEEYAKFVDGGGYEQMAIWDREIWPALLDFVDQTGHPGPRLWRKGMFPRGQERLPVVGISWYEAAAYARWVGKRLPTDAEWIKAGSWPVSITGQPPLERRYPWGEAMDHTRANLWGGAGRIVAVDEYGAGTSVGGVQQLIGNVWEWTTDLFTLDEDSDSTPALDQGLMKSIRGGAFDTYLDAQATCHFQSGDRALARKHNISFRCAMAWEDVAHPASIDESSGEEIIGDETGVTLEETPS